MQYDELKGYLDLVTSPEQSQMLVDACQLLHDAGVDGHDFAIQQEIALADDGDTSIALNSIYNAINPLLIVVIANFGVTVSEDANTAQLTDILNGLMLIDNYGDPATIITLCDAIDGPEEALSEILTYVGRYSIGEYMSVIHVVNPSLLVKIAEVLNENHHGLEDDIIYPLPEIAHRARTRLRTFMQQYPNTLAMQSVVHGMRLGLPFAIVLETQNEALHELPPEAIPEAILGLALASDLEPQAISTACMEEIDALLNDMNKITAAKAVLNNLMKGLDA